MSFIAGYLLGLEDGGGGGVPLTIIPKTITENGEYAAIDDNADGYNPVVVALPINALSVTKNGTYIAADYGLEGFDPVNVNVPDRYDEGYKDGYDEGFDDGYEEGDENGYDGGYDDAFELAKGYYSDTADTSRDYYVRVFCGEPVNAGSWAGITPVSLHYYDTETMTEHRAIYWNNSAGSSFDTQIISVRWLNERTIQIKSKGYNKSHTSVSYCTHNYTLPNGYNSSNTAVGSADPTRE